MRINLWKYPLTYVSIIIVSVGIVGLLNSLTDIKVTLTFPEWIRPVILVPILIALLSTNVPDFLPKKIVVRLKWLHSRPGINQFYYFVAFQAFAILTSSVLVTALPGVYLLYIADLVVNLLGGLTAIVYIYFMLRIMMNNSNKL